MEHALVSGGAGLIGSHLCAALLDRGWAVTCIDNLSTGSERNIAHLLDQPQFHLVRHDVVEPLPDLPRPDLIFHLASPASVPDYLGNPVGTLEVNSVGTLNLLSLARQSEARFLFTSTSEVYGDPLVHPQPESYWGNVNPSGPRACYDESKRFGEVATREVGRCLGVNVRIVRVFNTYGPHSRPDDGRIIPNFITQALQGKPITIYGDGSQTRSFCYVSDMVQGLLAAMFSPESAGQIFNLGNPDEHTVREMAEIVSALVQSEAGISYLPLPVDDPTRRCPDITRARSILHWEPQVDLQSGLARTVEWFQQVLQEPSLSR